MLKKKKNKTHMQNQSPGLFFCHWLKNNIIA